MLVPYERQGDVSIMKNIIFLIAALLSQFSFAQFSGNGFYRVQNATTGRYLSVIDNRASVNMATTDPDLAAILPIRNFDRIVGNPASVIYIYKAGDNDYSLRAQNVDSYNLMGVYLHLRQHKDGTYYAYATASGFTKYLCDEVSDYDEGWLMTGTVARNWKILPLNASSDNYFAALPEIEHNGLHYTTMYAAFPYKPVSDGIKMYYIKLVGSSVALMKEVKDGFVPAATPVIVECTSANYSDNKLDAFVSGGSEVSGNCLGGVYFDNSNNKHWNRVAYDPKTMRILGKLSDGSLGFVTADLDYLPANKAFLKVPAGSPAEIRMVTEEEYNTDIEGVEADKEKEVVCFDLSGRRVNKTTNGVYITSTGLKVCR